MQSNGMSTEPLPQWPGSSGKPDPRKEPETAKDLGIRELKVVWGEETHNPIQYHTVKCGGLEATVVLGADDDVKEVARRAWQTLDEIAREQFEAKLDGFFGRARQAASRATKR